MSKHKRRARFIVRGDENGGFSVYNVRHNQLTESRSYTVYSVISQHPHTRGS